MRGARETGRYRRADIQLGSQAGRKTGRQKGRQTYRQTDTRRQDKTYSRQILVDRQNILSVFGDSK